MEKGGETGEEAACLLRGGLRTVLEGLEVSRAPCAEVLSVAGFSAVIPLFPGWRTVYSEGKRDTLRRKETSLF